MYYNILKLYKKFDLNRQNSTTMQMEYKRSKSKDILRKRISITCELISQAYNIAKDSGVELIVIMPPCRFWMFSATEETKFITQTAFNAISELSEEKGFQFIFLGEDFKQYPEPEKLYLKNDMHWSPMCHVFLSNLLIKYLKNTVAKHLEQVQL